jgi:hypothetical protein
VPIYRERVLPSVANIVLPAIMFLTVYAISLPLAPSYAVLLAVVATLALTAVLFFTSPTIELTESQLLCGKAAISREFLGKITVIQRAQIFEELGRNLDARAFLSIQASVKGLVKIEITDSQDPTPYWLVSTRNPELLKAKLNN